MQHTVDKTKVPWRLVVAEQRSRFCGATNSFSALFEIQPERIYFTVYPENVPWQKKHPRKVWIKEEKHKSEILSFIYSLSGKKISCNLPGKMEVRNFLGLKPSIRDLQLK